MITPTRAISPSAACAAGEVPAAFSTWRHISCGIEAAVWDAANRAKDRQDEAIDAMRVSNGMTLDQYLESVTAR
jgi:hypothetical protein